MKSPQLKFYLLVKKTENFPLESKIRPGCLNILLEVLVRAIKQEKEMKSIKIRNKEATLSLCTNKMILHVKKAKDSTKRIIRTKSN